MCDCRKNLEDRLKELFAHKNPDGSGHRVELQGFSICLGETVSIRAFMPYKTTAEFPLKKGGTKIKSGTGNMFFNYCPWCGVKNQP
jgi:hypothetical protein